MSLNPAHLLYFRISQSNSDEETSISQPDPEAHHASMNLSDNSPSKVPGSEETSISQLDPDVHHTSMNFSDNSPSEVPGSDDPHNPAL